MVGRKLAVAGMALVALCAGLVIGWVRPGGALALGPPDPAVAWLRSDKAADRRRAAIAILVRRDQTREELWRAARNLDGFETGKPEKPATVKAAIVLLGKLRDPSAAQLLASYLTLHPFESDADRALEGESMWRACAGALADIGVPAQGTLLGGVAHFPDDAKFVARAGYTVRAVLGPHAGAVYVQERIDATKDADQRRRLVILQEYVTGKRDWRETLNAKE